LLFFFELDKLGDLAVTPGLPAEPSHGAWNGRRQDLSFYKRDEVLPEQEIRRRRSGREAPGWEGRRGCVARRLASVLARSGGAVVEVGASGLTGGPERGQLPT
jgi:hypothetical protein